MDTYDDDYLEGIRRFNAHDFFEAHEAWEAVWMHTSGRVKLFYKGLIHAAVALHHFGNGNLHGARKVFGSCVQYLAPFVPRCLGIDVERFLAELRACFSPLEDEGTPRAGAVLDESLVPQIKLDPAPAATADGE